jgi:exopolyphosphatase/guanosine-5'-triphosphate,3'-diphosphate pyrophosphatase
LKILGIAKTKKGCQTSIMEKFALFEVGTTHIRLTLAKGVAGEHFHIYKDLHELVHINEHLEADGLIKSAKIFECVTIIKMYKKICEAEGVKNYIAIAAESLSDAKNYKSFIDELGICIGQEFKSMTKEDETNAIYTAVVNTVDVAKGLIVNISSFSTRIIHYSRRMILDSVIIPFGSVSLFERSENSVAGAVDLFKKELTKVPFLKGLDPETQIVGVGDVFISFGRIARKMRKYPVEMDYNYTADSQLFYQVFDFIKGLDVEKKMKLKGISSHSAKTILCGMCILDATLLYTNVKSIVTSEAYRNVGLLYNAVVPSTLEKPITDILGHSIDVIHDIVNLDKAQARRHYNLSLILFRQIRVLHKLPRSYAKVLRIASSLYALGQFTNRYFTILSAPIRGATHKEIVLAAFASSFKKWENFDMMEWLRFKDMMTDEDLDAVRKISMILVMAEAFDVRGSDIIKDISCDLLGESVILKLLTTTDVRSEKVDVNCADVEIFQARKYSHEFQKVFKRSLELL